MAKTQRCRSCPRGTHSTPSWGRIWSVRLDLRGHNPAAPPPAGLWAQTRDRQSRAPSCSLVPFSLVFGSFLSKDLTGSWVEGAGEANQEKRGGNPSSQTFCPDCDLALLSPRASLSACRGAQTPSTHGCPQHRAGTCWSQSPAPLLPALASAQSSTSFAKLHKETEKQQEKVNLNIVPPTLCREQGYKQAGRRNSVFRYF